MAGTEVASLTRDIIDGFKNGLNIFKGGLRRHKRRQTEPSRDDGETVLHDSLSQRPKDIQNAYDRSVNRHGRKFEIGDQISQTRIARILLTFNTGLIRLLNHTMSQESQSRRHSRSSLLDLSEIAAKETLSALSELDNRLSLASTSPSLAATDMAVSRNTKPRSSSQSSSGQVNKRPSPSPHLKHGGWVRSKSDPSVVSVVVLQKSKKGDCVRHSMTSPKSAQPESIASSQVPKSTSNGKQPRSKKSVPVVKPKPMHLKADSIQPRDEPKPIEQKSLARQPSMYIVPGDFFAALSQAYPPAKPLYQIA